MVLQLIKFYKDEEEIPIIKDEKPKSEWEEWIEIFKAVGIMSAIMIIITLIWLACL